MSEQPTHDPTFAIVEQIAEKEGVQPVDLRPPLHSVIDTDGLHRVVDSMHEDGVVEFGYRTYRVSVYGNGRVEVSKKASV